MLEVDCRLISSFLLVLSGFCRGRQFLCTLGLVGAHILLSLTAVHTHTALYPSVLFIHALRVGHDTVRHGTTRYDAPHCYTHWVSGTQWVGVGVRWVETARWAEEEAELPPGRGQGPREGGSMYVQQ